MKSIKLGLAILMITTLLSALMAMAGCGDDNRKRMRGDRDNHPEMRQDRDRR